MDKINNSYKKLFLKGTKLSLLSGTNTSLNKSIEKSNFNSKIFNKNNIPYNKNVKISYINENIKNNKNSENKKLPYFINVKNNFSSKNPSGFQEYAIIQTIKKNNSAENIFKKEKYTEKIDLPIQRKIFPSTVKKIPNIRLNLFKNLIDNIPQNGLKDINYVLECPFRGVQKISLLLSKSSSTDRYKKNYQHKEHFFYQTKINKSLYGLNDLSFSKNKNNYLSRDKYSEIKKEKVIENPIGRISKISGISCYKLRQAINYSLRNNFKNFALNKIEQKELDRQINKYINNNDNSYNKYKKKYSKIELKSTKKNKFDIKDNFIDLEDENPYENIILSKKGNKFRYH